MRTAIQNIPLLVPTAADYDSLLGNGRDTLVLTGGTLTGATVEIGADVAWRVEGTSYVDVGGLLRPLPGSGFAVATGHRFVFQNGGRLEARGKSDSVIVFTAIDTTASWLGLEFSGAPGDTSYLTNVVLSHSDGPYRTGSWSYRPVLAMDSHPLVIDSSVVRQMRRYGVALQSAGSRFSRSVVDTAGGDVWQAAVELGASTTFEGSLVRSATGIGAQITGADVTVSASEITTSGSHGVYVTTATGVLINDCNIFDNAGNGVENVTGVVVDATNNWWGDADGPTGTSGDGVSADVNYTPWATAPFTISPPAPPLPAPPMVAPMTGGRSSGGGP
jgi:hypothetical protein